MNAFMKEAFEKRDKLVNVIDIEKKSAVPQAGPWMSEELLRNITKANDNATVIKKQADTLHILQKDWERNNEMMNELVKNDKRTADQVKYLDKLKQEIMPSLDKQLKTTIDALGSLEAKQQKNMEEIKQEIKSEKSEEDKFLTAKLLEKKSKDLDDLKTENFKIFKKEKEVD
jgi:formate dehydrogenase maturation protein FdhE